jgi:hypothetical protein
MGSAAPYLGLRSAYKTEKYLQILVPRPLLFRYEDTAYAVQTGYKSDVCTLYRAVLAWYLKL